MTIEISPLARERLRASLPIVEAREEVLAAALSHSLAAADPARGAIWARTAATSLLRMLIAQVRILAGGGIRPLGLHGIRAEHAYEGIERFHLARFGDSLAAVMADEQPALLPRPVGAAWCDTFWKVVAALRREQEAESRIEAEDGPIRDVLLVG